MISLRSFYSEWKIKRRHQRVYMLLGVVFLLLALIGAALPVVPQIPFAIASAFFFSRGSQKIHLAIRHNKIFGKTVCEWEDHQVIRPRTKFFSVGAMIIGALGAHFQLPLRWSLVVAGLFLICILFVITRRSAPNKVPNWKRWRLRHKAKTLVSKIGARNTN